MSSGLTRHVGSAAALLTLQLAPPWDARLRSALQQHGFEILEATANAPPEFLLARAEIALLQGDPMPACLQASSLRWLHCGHAGLDRFLPGQLFRPGLSITSAAGRSAPALAEHALFMLMQLAYADNELRWYRRWRQWRAPPVARRRALHGRTLGIVGMGHVGATLAAYARALDMQVLGWRRHAREFPAPVQQGFSVEAGDDFNAFLARCEFLVLACSLNQSSEAMIGATQLRALPQGAFLVNIARAGLVDQKALRAALDRGHLGGAGLDVHFPEPLNVSSPWWSHPKVVMSPHHSPRLDSRDQRHFELIVENLQRYRAGLELRNLMHPEDAFEAHSMVNLGLAERVPQRLWRWGFALARRWSNR